jgi:hypothetical protein
VRGQGVVVGQLDRDRASGIGAEPFGLMERGQFGQFSVGFLTQFSLFLGQCRQFGVALAGDRDVLAQGHRHRPGHQAGEPGGEDRPAGAGGASYPDN